MSTPICPVHQSPMNVGQKGGFYCPKKTSDGSYCKERVAAPKPDPVPAAAPPGVPNWAAGPIMANESLAAACVEAASVHFGGNLPPEMQDDVIAYAVKFYRAMKGVMA